MINKRCCGAECSYEIDQEEYGECHGALTLVDEQPIYDESGDMVDSYLIHTCEGHEQVYYNFGDKSRYIPEKKEEK